MKSSRGRDLSYVWKKMGGTSRQVDGCEKDRNHFGRRGQKISGGLEIHRIATGGGGGRATKVRQNQAGIRPSQDDWEKANASEKKPWSKRPNAAIRNESQARKKANCQATPDVPKCPPRRKPSCIAKQQTPRGSEI